MKQPISPEPKYGSDEDYFFNVARALKGSDEAEVAKEISLYTDAQLTMAVSMWEAWLGRVEDRALVAELEGRSAFHLELEARRSRAALCLGEHPAHTSR
jgi:hypothetical protein